MSSLIVVFFMKLPSPFYCGYIVCFELHWHYTFCVVIIFLWMLVMRWWRCGDSRGGCGACRARYQRVVHRYVWKDGSVPARRTHRSAWNPLWTSYLFCPPPWTHMDIYFFNQSIDLLMHPYHFWCSCLPLLPSVSLFLSCIFSVSPYLFRNLWRLPTVGEHE